MVDAVEAIRERIEAKRAALAQAAEDQSAHDWNAYEKACEEHGYDACARLSLPRKIDGLPTFCVVRAADADIVTIHRQRILKARKDSKGAPDPMAADRAIAEVGRACLVYPDADTIDEIKKHFPTIEKDAGIVGRDMSQAHAVEEGKE
jgi:Pyruvate/2-oxoacid:ferredoxin oxidoreductase gamma subunit